MPFVDLADFPDLPKDEEKATKLDAIVNEVGVTMSDVDFELAYRKYKDSVGAAYSIDVASVTLGEGSSVAINTSGFANDDEGFVDVAVVFDSDEGQLPKEIRDKLLSQPGFHVVERDDGTREYVVRGYNTLEEAMAAMDQFKKDGMEVKGIAKVSEDEALEFVSQETPNRPR